MNGDNAAPKGDSVNPSVCNFGEHLTLDGYCGDFHKLNDKDLVYQCLDELPTCLKMTKLCSPHVYQAPDNQMKDPGGWSGFVIVAESHISIHTFPARKFVSIDVYTCASDLDIEFVSGYFKSKFSLQDIETNFIKRGTRYPVCNLV